MSVEPAVYIADLVNTAPPSTDPRSQGDDHLRLIKAVLQNSFSGSSRQFQIPSVAVISTSTSVTKANGESILYTSTASGAVTLTMPSLVAADAGWKVRVIKTSSDANPIFIAPNTGTINSGGVAGLAKARRCIPGVQVTVIWDGAAWFVTRVHALPIGSCIEFHGSALPAGFEWPSGQTLSSALNYPEYNAVMGGLTTLDKRGRIGVPLDNLGGTDSGRLNTAGCGLQGVRTTLGGTGGSGSTTLVTANLPAYTPAGTVATTTTISQNANSLNNATTSPGGAFAIPQPAAATITASSTSTFTGTAQGGSSTAFNNAPVSIMVNQILVVE